MEKIRNVRHASPLYPQSQTFATKKLDQDFGALRANENNYQSPQLLPEPSTVRSLAQSGAQHSHSVS